MSTTKRRECPSEEEDGDNFIQRSSVVDETCPPSNYYEVDTGNVWENPLLAKNLLSQPAKFETLLLPAANSMDEEAMTICSGEGDALATPDTEGDGCKGLKHFSFEELKQLTNDFSEANLIGKFQFGKLYRGYLDKKEVLVKKWEDPLVYLYWSGDIEAGLDDEIKLLDQPKMRDHPNLVKMIGYCKEDDEKLGIVYDLKPLDSLYNLIKRGSFTWLQRIKVIIEFAQLLEYMHEDMHEGEPESSYVIRNIDAAHLILDEDYSPILVDFSMAIGGIFPFRDRHRYLKGCRGYIDFYSIHSGTITEDTDIYGFGVLLLLLISKRVYFEDYVQSDICLPHPSVWAELLFELKISTSHTTSFSLVDESLQMNEGFDPSDGQELTMLALKCMCEDRWERPFMNEVVAQLLNLQVFRDHAKFLGVMNQQHCGRDDHISPSAFS